MKVASTPVSGTEPGASPKTFNDRFEETARRHPDRVAFRQKISGGYRQVTYREVHRQAHALATALVGMGLRPGERVAVLSENRPEWVITYLGIYLAGGSVVPLDPQISPTEWKRLLEDSEAKAVFVSGLHWPKVRPVVHDHRPLMPLICFDSIGGDRDARAELPGLLEWAESLNPPQALPESHLSDVVVIIYTSGTTGQPKGVMLSQDNIIAEIEAILETVQAYEDDKFLCLLPLHHVFASVVNFLVPLVLGAEVVFVDTLKRAEIMEALQKSDITILATVPQFFYLFYDRIQEELSKKSALVRKIFRAMLRLNHFSIHCLRVNLGKLLFGKVQQTFGSKLRLFVSGGSSFDPRVARDFFDMGFTILQGYGLTETTGAATVTRIEDNVVGSVGKPLPRVEISVADPDATGVGEVLIRGPVVMKGYYKQPDITSAAVRDGWFYSGDLGRLDARGNLYITGRKKEVIVLPNGKNIYPDELEAHYQQCPYIQEIAVLGIAEPGGRGDRLHAVVVPNFDYLKTKKIANAREILRDEIGKFSNQLPKYKRLMSYQIEKDPLPRTTTRKIKRLELKRLIESGQMKETEAAAERKQVAPEDRAVVESPVGQEVLSILRETYRRDVPVEPDMNLELDLGFDSMERVELLTSLEQALNLQLSEDFGADIFTVRDLIMGLEQQVRVPGSAAGAQRQSWKTILSEESLNQEGAWRINFAGTGLSLFKFLGLKTVYWLLFRPFLGLKAHGLERLPRTGAFLIAPNHLSYLDSFVVMSVLPYRIVRRVFFVGASEYFSTWYMKLLGRLANIVPVDPDAHLLRAMKVGAYGLRQGRVLCIFPEGARSFEGKLQEFKKGAAILAREIGVPIVPVGIRGTYEVWARDSLRIRAHKVSLSFGAPLVLGPRDEEDPYSADTELLRDAVSRLI